MALVDYGSSGEEDDVPATTIAATVPKRNKPGPKRILLDLPKPSTSSTVDEPPAKRPKFTLGEGKSGLAGLLPAPKAPTPATTSKTVSKPVSLPQRTEVEDDDEERKALKRLLDGAEEQKSTSMMPASLSKGKKPATQEAPAAADFFGLGTPAAPSTSTSYASTSMSSAPAFSAAPTTKARAPSPPRTNFYATLPAPTPANPYPGFHALPSGQWVADQPEEWVKWCEMNGMSTSGQALTPAGADVVDVAGVGTDAGGVEDDGIPSKVVGETKLPEKAVVMGGRGGKKHQLSSLLYAAHANREELEDKIAQAKANRKSGGQKYGF